MTPHGPRVVPATAFVRLAHDGIVRSAAVPAERQTFSWDLTREFAGAQVCAQIAASGSARTPIAITNVVPVS